MKTDEAAPVEPLLRPVMPELDAVRGVAVSMVLLYHAFWTSYWALGVHRAPNDLPVRWLTYASEPGWLGVQLFFVLSGFLITGILLDSRPRPDYFKRFYFRRALRILPPYLLLLAILLVTGRAPLNFVLLAAAFAANFSTLFGMALAYAPLWSLAVEEQYYLLWPTVVRKVAPLRIALFGIALFLLAPLIRWNAFTSGAGASQFAVHYTWFTYDGLVLGSLTALWLRSPWATRERVKGTALAVLAGAALVSAIGMPFGLFDRTRAPGAAFEYTIMNIFFASSLVLALVIGSGPWRRLVHRPVLMFLGYISYGLYLCHVLVFEIYDRFAGSPPVPRLPDMLVRFAIAGGGAILAAWLSRKYYEERFLRMKR